MGNYIFMWKPNISDSLSLFDLCAGITDGQGAVGDAGLISVVSGQWVSLKDKKGVTIVLLF